MAMNHPGTNDAFTPAAFGKFLNIALQSESVAMKLTKVIQTDAVAMTFPRWDADPAINWLAELATITATDGVTAGVTVIPSKVGGITRLSNELAEDSSPEVAELAVSGLVNQIAHAIDTAFVGNTVTNGPSGLLSIAPTVVDSGASLTNLDSFLAARFAAQNAGAELTHWLMKPATAEAITKLKKATGSNESLLQFDASGLTIAGLPVLTLPSVDAATVAWGIDSRRTVTVLRKDAEVNRSKDSGFYNDALDVRAITRVGFGFRHPGSVVRIYDAA